MNKKIKLFIYTTLLSFLLISCEKEDNLEAIEDTLYVNIDGAQMPVYIYGNGTKKQMIILIHGGPGGNGLEYRSGIYADILEKELMVAYWDQRGQGMSQGKYGEDVINVQQMANDLEAVVLSVKKKFGDDLEVYLLGHSWGGMLGTKFMVESSKANLVDGWIEANGAHDIPFLNKEAIKMFRKIAQEQIDAGNSVEKWQEIKEWAAAVDENNITEEQGGEINSKGFEVEGYLSDDGLISQSDPGEGDLAILINSPLNSLKSLITGNYTSNALNDEVESKSLTSQLSNITKPCLFIYSKYDFVVPPALGEDAFQKVSSREKKLIIFEKSGHSSMSSEAELFSSEILSFIQKVSN